MAPNGLALANGYRRIDLLPMAGAAPKNEARRKIDDHSAASAREVSAKAAHPVRPGAQKAAVAEAHREIAERYPKVLGELAR